MMNRITGLKMNDRVKEIDAVYAQASAPGGAMDIFKKYAGAGPELKGYYLGDMRFKDTQTGAVIGKYLAFLCVKRSTFPYMPLLRRGADEGVWDGYAKLVDELDRREANK